MSLQSRKQTYRKRLKEVARTKAAEHRRACKEMAVCIECYADIAPHATRCPLHQKIAAERRRWRESQRRLRLAASQEQMCPDCKRGWIGPELRCIGCRAKMRDNRIRSEERSRGVIQKETS